MTSGTVDTQDEGRNASIAHALSVRDGGDPAAALRLLTPFLDDPNLERGLAEEIAYTWFLAGDLDRAETAAEAAFARFPDSSGSLATLAAVATRRGDHAAAAERLEQARALAPDNANIAFQLGESRTALSEGLAAEEAYYAALNLRPDHSAARLRLAQVLRERGAVHQCIHMLRSAPDAVKRDPDVALQIAALLAEGGDNEAADSVYRGIEQGGWTSAHHALTYGLWLRARGALTESTQRIEAATRTAGATPDLWNELAYAYRLEGRREAAVQAYLEVLAAEPDNLTAVRGLAQVTAELGHWREARAILERAILQVPDDLDLRFELLHVHAQAGNADRAIALARELHAARPEPRTLQALASALAGQGLWEEVAAVFESDRALAPPSVAILAGAAYQTLGRFDAAADAYASVSETDAEWDRAMPARIDLALLRDDVDGALNAADDWIARRPDWPPARAAKSRCLIRQGRFGDARSLLRNLDAAALPEDSLAELLRAAAQCCGPADFATFCPPPTDRVSADVALAAAQGWLAFGATETAEPWLAKLEAAAPPHLKDAVALARADALESAGRTADALALASSIGDASGAAFERRARLLFKSGAFAEAEVALREYLRLEAPQRRARGQVVRASQTLLGQLLNEAALNPEATEEGPATWRARFEAWPNSTPAAILALQETLATDSDGAKSAGKAQVSIPRVIGVLVPWWASHLLSVAMPGDWASRHPDWEVVPFTYESSADYLRDRLSPQDMRLFSDAPSPIHAAAVLRYAFLAETGGLFIANGRQTIDAVPPEWLAGARLLGFENRVGALSDDVIGMAQGDGLAQTALDEVLRSLRDADSDIPWLANGPGLLTRTVMSAHADGTAPAPSRSGPIRIMPYGWLRRISATQIAEPAL